MPKIESHRDLIVWQKALDASIQIYQLARKFPKQETYGLVSQLTRACVSVPANIAEGHARGTPKDYAHFVAIAKGSLMEAETYLLLAQRLGYASDSELRPALAPMTEISKMLTSLRSKLLG